MLGGAVGPRFVTPEKAAKWERSCADIDSVRSATGRFPGRAVQESLTRRRATHEDNMEVDS